jgi:hypothetical protein
MKKLLIILSLLVPFSILAQRLYEPNFGMVLSGNFTTVHANHENYAGRGMGSIAAFFQNPITPYHSNRYLNRLDYTVEAGLSWLGFRDKNSDKRFQANYIDLSLYLNYVPDQMSDDLRLFVGFRPSYLNFTQSSILNFGTYSDILSDSQNINQIGQIDYSGVIGVSVNMGEVANLELRYAHSFTNNTNRLFFNGRPSTVEVGLRLSAVRLRDKLVKDEINLVGDLNKRAQGTLLVMLEEPDEKLIKQLVDEEKIKDASFVRELQFQTNKNIIQAFRSEFDFCRVEFFMNKEANSVAKGKFEGVFVDDQLNPKPYVDFDTSNYFIASFIEDISDYTQKQDYGLYFYNKNFIQLPKPYNTNANTMGLFIGGDPLNYIRRVKTSGYFADDFKKVLKKVNAKLQLARIPVNGS